MEVIFRVDDKNYVLLHLCTVCQNVSHNQLTVLLKTQLPWTIIFFYKGKKTNKRRSGFIYSRIKSPGPKSKNNWLTQLHNYYHNWKETAHFQFAKFCWCRHILSTSFWILTSTACCDKGNNDCWTSAIKRLHFYRYISTKKPWSINKLLLNFTEKQSLVAVVSDYKWKHKGKTELNWPGMCDLN